MDKKDFLEVIEKAKENNLKTIDLPFKNLTEIPQEIGKLIYLERLYLHGNKIAKIPNEIGNLVNLEVLDLACNKLKSIPAEIGQLRKLKELYLRTNRLTTLPAEIGKLDKLERLYVYDNQITEFPDEITGMSSLNGFWVHDNKLHVYIPPEILERDEPSEIITYYLQHKNSKNRDYSNEAKILIVGEAGAGKTSLLNQIVHRKFNQDEDKTEGININKQKFISIDGKEIRLNLWDFGGQEIIRSTHQFFLTRRSLYILVIDARQGEQDLKIENWLQLILSFGGDSPVIVVVNKVDEHQLELDRRGLRKKYPNIKAFTYISCKEDIGIDDLSQLIIKEISHLKHIESAWLPTQFNIKNKLEEMTQDYISYEEYEKLCRSENVESSREQEILIDLLHDLGIVLHYHDHLTLKHKNILNPEWITEGVYRILNSNELYESKGILDSKKLVDILDPNKHPPETHSFIIQMMKRFDLCIELYSPTDQVFLVPDLLPKEEISLEWDYEQALNFEYKYNFLPTSIISRFIVRAHSLILSNLYWRAGVILSREGTKALLKADYERRKIYISVCGKRSKRTELLSIIRCDFERIHKTIPSIDAEQRIVPPDNQDISVSYSHLLKLEEMGYRTFIPEGSSKEYHIEDLLNGIESQSDRSGQHNNVQGTNGQENRSRLWSKVLDNREEFEILSERIHRARKAHVLETSPSERLKLENEIGQLEKEREELEKSIVSLELELE